MKRCVRILAGLTFVFCCMSMQAQSVSDSLVCLDKSLSDLAGICWTSVSVTVSGIEKKSYTGVRYTIPSIKKNIILLKEANIVKLKDIGAIVNAANSGLTHGGGVCGAIGDAANYTGDQWNAVMKKAMPVKKTCPTGSACITGSFKLETQGIDYIIHAVGPNCQLSEYKDVEVNGNPAMCNDAKNALKSAYQAALYLASGETPKDSAWAGKSYPEVPYYDSENKKVAYKAKFSGLKSIAFPFISSLNYKCYLPDSAKVALDAVIDFFKNNPKSSIEDVYFTLFDKDDYVLFTDTIKEYYE